MVPLGSRFSGFCRVPLGSRVPVFWYAFLHDLAGNAWILSLENNKALVNPAIFKNFFEI